MDQVVEQVPDRAPAADAVAIPWAALTWFTALLIGAYYPILRWLVVQWATDEDVSHGFFVPLVALFIAWQRREKILALELKPAWWGLAIMAWGASQAYLGMLGAEIYLQRTSFLITLTGLLLVVGGTALVRELAFPLLLLPFMIPLPAVIYNQLTFPLQLFASQVAEYVLALVGIPVLRDGNVLELASQKLSVAEACSGIRSLLSLSFLSLVYAYFFDRRVWMRWVLLVLTIPIAILANAGRVTVTGMLSEVNPELARGFFHSLEGWIIFMIALAMLLGTHAIIKRAPGLFRRRPDDLRMGPPGKGQPVA
ncbi:MAG TPA: exosortase/archaeosortase family protein [Bryobacteraceae bacterium]|nr:exosortase/archaeosortase family protein [Bryobacteraceae bacterium]